jgi:site-specific recombinase XerD
VTTPGVALAASSREPCARLEHAERHEWRAFLARLSLSSHAIKKQTHHYQHFRDRWPDLSVWAAQPLALRLGRIRGQNTTASHADPVSYRARAYLKYLAVTGRARYDWDFVLTADAAGLVEYGAALGLPFNRAWLARQQQQAVGYGWSASTINRALLWTYSRFILHTGDPNVDRYGLADLQELRHHASSFNNQHAALSIRGSGDPTTRLNSVLGHLSGVQGLWFCQGKTDAPHVRPFRREEPVDEWTAPPRIAAVITRYCGQKSHTTLPAGVRSRQRELRLFVDWLTHHRPGIDTFADVRRGDIEAYLEHLRVAPRPKHRRPLGITTRRQVISFLRQFFDETAQWEHDDVPGRQLIARADSPRAPLHVPRFIPEQELAAAMQAIRDLPDPHQRAALLTVRWSGARRDEIRRLELDCLDSYPDGTPRLRIPAGKTKAERMVPIAAEAANAIREVQTRRTADRDLGMLDRVTERRVRYLFLDRGRLRSPSYLYDEPLLQVCQRIGLVPADGTGNAITAHRFRHTVGTQLADKHARIQTIMSILGHTNATMAMVYSAISDEQLVNDYTSALKPGAILAGPAAYLIRHKELSAKQLDWLNSNYFKSELELGACLKLPEEGPCECELFWLCARFFTTEGHAPRIRRRWHREQQLINDALERGWNREVERHEAFARRCVELLAELGQTLDGDTDDDTAPQH